MQDKFRVHWAVEQIWHGAFPGQDEIYVLTTTPGCVYMSSSADSCKIPQHLPSEGAETLISAFQDKHLARDQSSFSLGHFDCHSKSEPCWFGTQNTHLR